MILVNSRASIWLLTRRFLKINRGRNVIAILAIIMTAVMFTASFTSVCSVIRSTMSQDMRTSSDASHISLQELTEDQFQKIRQYDKTKEMGYTIFLSTADNEELRTISAEIRYADENGAKGFLCMPTVGNLPREEGEVATSTIVLDLLGVPHEIGSTVTLTYTTSQGQVTEDFHLSGYWEGDSLPMAQFIWVSQEYCLSHAKTATRESIAMGDYEGDYNLNLWFDNVLQLDKYKQEIDRLYQVSETQARIDINPAYDRMSGEDGFPFGVVAAIVLLIFLAGYLIIFNVFHISVKNDIKAYGLLKNIGTTGRQLKSIVHRQAVILSGIGIPIGLLLGWFVGKAMMPYLLESAPGMGKMDLVMSNSPWIFLAAAVFSFGTVSIACARPCQIVAKVSPVEAIRMTEGSIKSRRRKSRQVTPVSMAFENLRRTWKKSVLVILSLTLPILLLNCVYTVQKGFDFDLYVDTYISSDFRLTGCINSGRFSDFHALTPQIMDDLKTQENVKSLACVYESEVMHELSKEESKTLEKMMDTAEKEQIYDDIWARQERKMLADGQVPSHVMGLNQAAFEKLHFQKESCTWEEFSKGDYVIINTQENGLGDYCKIGDQVTVKLENQEKTFTVLAIGQMPYDLDYPFASGTYYDWFLYLPEEVYLGMGGDEGAMSAGVEVDEGTDREFSDWLENYLSNKPQILMESRMDVERECRQFAGKCMMILGLLCLVLLVIGVLNFFNTSAVSVLSRKRELSLLEAVGMTKRQVRKMLCTEGCFYFLISMLLADTIGLPLMRLIVQRTAGRTFYFVYHPSVLASFVALPVLAAIAFGVPWYHYRKMCRESIVERIREE